MLYEDPFTIGIVGKAHFNPICDPNLFQPYFQYQMQLVSFRKAEWILSDEKHRVVVKGLEKLWCCLSFSLVVLVTSGAVSALWNIRSSWWIGAPLLFYFFFLWTVGASSDVLSMENTGVCSPGKGFSFQWLFLQLDQRTEQERGICFVFLYIDSPPTLLVGKILLSLTVSEHRPWSQRLPRSSAFCLSVHNPEISRLIAFKLRASNILKTTGVLAMTELTPGIIFKLWDL